MLQIGDCMELSKGLEDNSINLVITSPPYADTLSYGRKVTTYDEGDYADWFLPLAIELHRATDDRGSFILNINDRVMDGQRSIYVYDLICRMARETQWTLVDRYIWSKRSGIPMGKTWPNHCRLDDKIEYIFHFAKTRKNFKYDMDAVREPYSEVSIARMKASIPENLHKKVDEDGTASHKGSRIVQPHPLGKIPTTVFDFPTSGTIRGNKHPAAFHPDLPRWFIKWLTDPGDVVLDPFMGSGSTAVACKEEGRDWIGFELNDTYKDIIAERLADIESVSDLTGLFK